MTPTSTSIQNGDPASENLRIRLCVQAVSSLLLLSSAGIKSMLCCHRLSMQTSVATGTKGVCHHCLVCKANQYDYFTLWTSGKLYLLK